VATNAPTAAVVTTMVLPPYPPLVDIIFLRRYFVTG
jgi:hypothetical protein